MKSIPVLLTFLCLATFLPAQEIVLESYASGFSQPVDITHAGDGRLFITERAGRIRIIDENGTILSNPFLNIQNQVNSDPNERGLLGLIFHPDYANNGYFYVNYTRSNGDTRISRFSVANDPNTADPNSEVILMDIPQPFWNHNAGDLEFGPDGYLYIGTGDGGSGGDPGNRSQNPQDLLGKMLRIDVDGGTPYAIPADNPFVNDATTADEIWALGLRNPWRYSFDRETGDLWIGDVGQNIYEEIDFQPANSTGGENYGWRCYEGDASFNTSGCGNASSYVGPVYDYAHSGLHCSVTGGFVYRGCDYEDIVGMYIYADYCSGRFWGITPDGQGGWTNVQVASYPGYDVSTFGEDVNGELYVARLTQGRIYRVKSAAEPFYEITEDGSGLLTAPAGDFTYQWFFNGTEISNATLMTFPATGTGDYTVELTNSRGCTFTSEVYSFVVGVEELSFVENFNVTPNPFSTHLEMQLTVNTTTAITLELLDTQGHKILSEQHRVNDNLNRQFKLTELPAGVYFLSINSEEGAMVQKVVKY